MKPKFNLFGAFFFSLLLHSLFFLILFSFSPLIQRIAPDGKYKHFKVTLKIPEKALSSGSEKIKKLNKFESSKNNTKKLNAGTQKIVKAPEKTEIKTTNDEKINIFPENKIEVAKNVQPQVLPITQINFSGNIAGTDSGNTGLGGFGNGNVASAGSGYEGSRKGLGNSSFEEAKKYYKELVTRLIYEKKSYPKLAKKMKAEGEVVIIFTITSSGKVINIQLKSPCKWDILNNEAIECIRRASPFPNPPFDIKEALVLSIKIVFELE